MKKLVLIVSALAFAGCYDSLVGGKCVDGYVAVGGACVSASLTGDGGVDPDGGAGPDGSVIDGRVIDGRVDDGGVIDGGVILGGIDGHGGGDADGGVANGDGGGTGSGDGGGTGTGDGGGTGNGDGGGTGSVDGGGTGTGDGGGTGTVDGGGSTSDGGTSDGGATSDGGIVTGDGGGSPDALVCAPPLVACDAVCIDVQSDPDNCGACNHVCPSGICSLGVCQGVIAGHIILIGHDYQTRHAAAVRVLGNAIDLAPSGPVRIGVFRGNADATHVAFADAALAAAAASVGRTLQRVDLATLPQNTDRSIIVILPQLGDGNAALALGTAWAPGAQAFVARAGIVVALGGENTVTQRVLVGAGLSDATAAAAATGQDLTVSSPSDAVAAGVTSPYHADSTTLSYHATRGVVVVRTPGGDAVVLDEAVAVTVP